MIMIWLCYRNTVFIDLTIKVYNRFKLNRFDHLGLQQFQNQFAIRVYNRFKLNRTDHSGLQVEQCQYCESIWPIAGLVWQNFQIAVLNWLDHQGLRKFQLWFDWTIRVYTVFQIQTLIEINICFLEF